MSITKIPPEADGVLKDGQMLRVPHTMMDASQVVIADAMKGGTPVLDHNQHRPHHATVTDEQRNAAIERQKAYDKRVSNAWKDAEPIYAGAHAPQGGPSNMLPTGGPSPSLRTADPMTVNSPGSAANVVGAAGVAELDAIQQKHQQAYNAKVSEAWRNPTNQGAK
jgi:hypothetical protein